MKHLEMISYKSDQQARIETKRNYDTFIRKSLLNANAYTYEVIQNNLLSYENKVTPLTEKNRIHDRNWNRGRIINYWISTMTCTGNLVKVVP